MEKSDGWQAIPIDMLTVKSMMNQPGPAIISNGCLCMGDLILINGGSK